MLSSDKAKLVDISGGQTKATRVKLSFDSASNYYREMSKTLVNPRKNNFQRNHDTVTPIVLRSKERIIFVFKKKKKKG